MPRAYAKFWRDLDALGLTRDHKACALYCHLVCVARVSPCRIVFNGVALDVQPGQVVTSRAELGVFLGLTDKELRGAIKKLTKWQLIESQGTNKYSLISIINSDACDSEGPAEGQQKGQQGASNGPAKADTEGQPFYKEEECKNERMENGSLNSCASGDAPGAKDSAKPISSRRHKPAMSESRMQAFEQFWEAFGYKKGRGGAETAWAAIPELTDSLVEQICEAARKEAAQRPSLIEQGRTPKWAQGWLSERRWEDDYDAFQPTSRAFHVPRGQPQAGMTWADIRNEKNKRACQNGLKKYLEKQGIAMEEDFEQQSHEEKWTVTVEE